MRQENVPKWNRLIGRVCPVVPRPVHGRAPERGPRYRCPRAAIQLCVDGNYAYKFYESKMINLT